MLLSLDDTIAAIAAGRQGAARGIVRISGDQAAACVGSCFVGPPFHRALQATVYDGAIRLGPPLGDLPCQLYYWPTRRSYTRQPSAEIHTLGSPPLLEAVVRQVCHGGARLAQPGEFTMRAFLAGRLDLTQAEAVLGVIEAEDRRQLDTALAQMAGGLSTPLNRLREQLLDLLAQIEAGLDFAEEDIEFVNRDEVERQLAAASITIASLADQMSRRRPVETTYRVVLIGRPNVGKSSLLNALSRDEAALVAPHKGTTRDYLCRVVDCDGLICLFIDTAGLEETAAANALPEGQSLEASLTVTGSLEEAAQAMTRRQGSQADLQILCLDATQPLDAWEQAELNRQAPRRLIVRTKIDVAAPFPPSSPQWQPSIAVSSVTGYGLDALRTAVFHALKATENAESLVVAGTAQRCGESLRLAEQALVRGKQLNQSQQGEELVAAEIHLALQELGKVVGAVYTDDILDRIFSRFCIGK